MKSTDVFPLTCGRQRPWTARVARACGKLEMGSDAWEDAVCDAITDNMRFGEMPVEMVQLILDIEVNVSISHNNFVLNGSNIVAPTVKLLSLLGKTDLDQIRLSDLRYPWRSFYVHLGDACSASIYSGVSCPIDGAYVQADNNMLVLSFVSRVGQTKHKPAVFFRPMRFMFFDLKAEDDRLSTHLAAPHIDRCFGYPADLAGVPDALKLIANVLCFISTQPDLTSAPGAYPDDAPSGLVRRTREKRPSLRDSAKRELLKRGFSAIRILDVPPEMRERSDVATGHEVAAHWRRGHWRRQPHGEGRSAIRLVWIKPTIVRADKGAPEGGHLYTVDVR